MEFRLPNWNFFQYLKVRHAVRAQFSHTHTCYSTEPSWIHVGNIGTPKTSFLCICHSHDHPELQNLCLNRNSNISIHPREGLRRWGNTGNWTDDLCQKPENLFNWIFSTNLIHSRDYITLTQPSPILATKCLCDIGFTLWHMVHDYWRQAGVSVRHTPDTGPPCV